MDSFADILVVSRRFEDNIENDLFTQKSVKILKD